MTKDRERYAREVNMCDVVRQMMHLHIHDIYNFCASQVLKETLSSLHGAQAKSQVFVCRCSATLALSSCQRGSKPRACGRPALL